MKAFLLLAFLITILLISQANAQSTLAPQEKCAEGAKKFERERFELRFNKFDISFENHYNTKLDKCFVRIGYFFGNEKGKDGEEHPSYGVGLYNVFENRKPIGELSYIGLAEIYVRTCYVGNNRCKSPNEFEALIKPYMED